MHNMKSLSTGHHVSVSESKVKNFDTRVIKLSEYARAFSVTNKTIINWHETDRLPEDVVRLFQLPGGHWRIEVKV